MKPLLIALLVGTATLRAGETPKPKEGAALLKTDIMGVFAHPDDETGMAATLAYYAYGRHAVIANVYCTRGEGGGNMVGTQWGPSLGILREAELRDCLNTVGVKYCYFLDRLDWAYTESAAATLEKWGKEETLERLVRLVRALRPEIIVTMNPAPSPGQHGHHQAAGVLATEAFTAAADPNRFPLQLTREGLTVWQPRRLFYGGAGTNQIAATITVNEPLEDGRTPAQIAGKALANHRSQAFGNFGNSPWLQRPQRFLLVKTFISNVATDLLGGLPAAEVSPKPIEFAAAPAVSPLALRFVPRPAVAHYEQWASEHGLEHVATEFHLDVPLVRGEKGEVRLEVMNNSATETHGELAIAAPSGWSAEPARQTLTLSPQQKATIALRVSIPENADDEELKAEFKGSGAPAAEASTKIHPVVHTRVPRVQSAPAVDGSGSGWSEIPGLEITPAQLVQGKVKDAADSSATFHLAHDGKTLFVDVQVRDDVVVSNIQPNDIRGHWRSDSVEICIDPAAGAEHTMGCYKIGIFPFDSSGHVRGARDADANQGLIEETAPGTRIASAHTPDGYRVQAAIPFSEIGLKTGQTRLGFNIIIYDGDKADAAPGENINESRIAWAPRSGVQGRPEDWGRIDLE